MDQLIQKVNGDIDEYRRITKYVSYIFGNDAPIHLVSIGMDDIYFRGLTDDLDPVFDYPWDKAKTKLERKRYLDEYCCLIETEPNKFKYRYPEGYALYPVGYCVAQYEDEITEIYDMAAIVIQKYVRGVITRSKVGVHNPFCDIGKKFLLRMYNST